MSPVLVAMSKFKFPKGIRWAVGSLFERETDGIRMAYGTLTHDWIGPDIKRVFVPVIIPEGQEDEMDMAINSGISEIEASYRE